MSEEKQKAQEIAIIGHFDPNKKCFFVDGEGAGEFRVTTDATQLSELIRSMAFLRGKALLFKIEPLEEGFDNADARVQGEVVR